MVLPEVIACACAEVPRVFLTRVVVMLVMLNPWVRACATRSRPFSGISGYDVISRAKKKIKKMDVVEWSTALALWISDWCCSVSMV